MVERITERFDDSDHPIFSAMKFADPAAWSVSLKRAFEHKEKTASLAFRARDPEVLNEEEKAFVSSFGNKELRVLIDHYGEILEQSDVFCDFMTEEDVPSRELIRKLIQEDWTALKKDLMTNQNVDPRIARYSFADFWKYVGSRHHKQRYKYLLVVIRIIFLIPVGSAECERIFSLMNRILDSAPTISHRNLVRRMRVKYLSPKEPPLEWFDPAIDKFLKRRRHTGDL